MAYDPAYYQANKAKYIERARARDAANPEAARERQRRSKQRHGRAHKLKARYGLTVEQYEEMLAAQAGHCAACTSTERLSVDHDHDTGLVRGILCHRCNVTIGYALNDPKTLRALATYLEQDPTPSS